jgi:sulfur carrier protein
MASVKYFFFNGQQYSIDSNITIRQLLQYFNSNSTLVVLEYNQIICKQTDWNQIFLQTNDKIEIVTIVGGG